MSASAVHQQVDTSRGSASSQLPAVHISRSRWYFHSAESQRPKIPSRRQAWFHKSVSEYSWPFLVLIWPLNPSKFVQSSVHNSWRRKIIKHRRASYSLCSEAGARKTDLDFFLCALGDREFTVIFKIKINEVSFPGPCNPISECARSKQNYLFGGKMQWEVKMI